MTTTVPTDQQKRIDNKAKLLRRALLVDAVDYAAEWQADSGNKATVQDGYILKVGAVRVAANELFDALLAAGLIK